MPRVIQYTHSKSAAAASGGLTDPAETVKPQRLPMHFGAPQEIPLPMRPAQLADITITFHHSSGGGKNQGKGEVRGGFRQHVRSVGDEGPPAVTRIHINIVVTDADVDDHPQFGGCVNAVFVEANT